MRLTLHDHIPLSAGDPHPEARPQFDAGERSRALEVMLERLAEVPRDHRGVIDVAMGWLALRAGIARHGDALASVWQPPGLKGPVAASLLLAGRSPVDDAAAVKSLRAFEPRLPFLPEDYDAVVVRPRPCLATLYLDARWYDNGVIDLAADALALAVLVGRGGVLKVAGADAPAPSHPSPRGGPLKFNFTRERLGLVMEMVTKKAQAAIERLPGTHFRVYPPPEFLARPFVLQGADIYDSLEATEWTVRWYDGREDRLSFGEFLGFLDQLGEIETAFHAAAGVEPAQTQPHNTSVWAAPPPDPGGRRPVTMKGRLDVSRLVEDEAIRRLLGRVKIKPHLDAARQRESEVAQGAG